MLNSNWKTKGTEHRLVDNRDNDTERERERERERESNGIYHAW